MGSPTILKKIDFEILDKRFLRFFMFFNFKHVQVPHFRKKSRNYRASMHRV